MKNKQTTTLLNHLATSGAWVELFLRMKKNKTLFYANLYNAERTAMRETVGNTTDIPSARRTFLFLLRDAIDQNHDFLNTL